MTYNLHPIFVHFPIALLLIYSIIRILPLQKWFSGTSWKHIERVLLLLGTLGAFASSATGEIAEELVRPNHALVEMHSLFAGISTWVYAILLLGEILVILRPYISTKISSDRLKNFVSKLTTILTNNILGIVLALVGLVAITLTGLLGGVMVYGTSADPFAAIVLKILGINL